MAFGNEKNTDIIFIDYIDIIRNPWIKVFGFIIEHAESFKNVMNVDAIPFEDDKITAWSMIRENSNPLYSFGLYDIDYDELLIAIMNAIPDLYDEEDDLLEIGQFSDMMAGLATTKEVYFYTPFYDSRVEYDVEEHFAPKIRYLYGDFYDAVQAVKPTVFMLNDVEKVDALLRDNLEIAKNSTILLTKHRYNFRASKSKEFVLEPALDEEFTEEFLNEHKIELNLLGTIAVGADAYADENLFVDEETNFFNYEEEDDDSEEESSEYDEDDDSDEEDDEGFYDDESEDDDSNDEYDDSDTDGFSDDDNDDSDGSYISDDEYDYGDDEEFDEEETDEEYEERLRKSVEMVDDFVDEDGNIHSFVKVINSGTNQEDDENDVDYEEEPQNVYSLNEEARNLLKLLKDYNPDKEE